MGIFIISLDIGPGDHRPVRSIYSTVLKEVRRGRRPDQISPNGSMFIVRTPETASALMARIAGCSRLDPQFDRLSVIDLAVGKVLIWGVSDHAVADSFPLLVQRFSLKPSEQ